MNKLLVVLALAALPAAGHAAIVSDDFDAYSAADLAGQGSWVQTGTVTTNPIQVVPAGAGKAVAMVSTGQDVYRALPSAVSNTGGTQIAYAADINVSAAQTGDYFVHLTSTGTNYYARLWARTSEGGYQLGISDYSNTPVYGSSVLSFNQSYRAAVVWSFVEGARNDTFAIYVDPSNVVEAQNTAYLNYTWTTTNAEPTSLTLVNLRQGGGSAGPTLTLDNLVVSSNFADVVVPEPGVIGLIGVAAMGMLAGRRRA